MTRPTRLIERAVRSTSQRATFFRFALVGSSIAVIDAALLYLLKGLPTFNVYTARVVSYAAAMSTGYLLNRYFTFHHLDRVRVLWHELLRFFSVHATGGLINFGVFSAIVLAGEHAGATGAAAALLPLAGVWIGGLVGLCFNYLMSRKLVFEE